MRAWPAWRPATTVVWEEGGVLVGWCPGRSSGGPGMLIFWKEQWWWSWNKPSQGGQRQALPFGARSSLPVVTGGDGRATFPSGSRWHGENPSVFCNMVASTRPKERFAAGPVPVWLDAAEDGRGAARPGRGGLGAGELPAPPSAASRGQLSSCPAANRGQKASCSLARLIPSCADGLNVLT